MPLVLSCLFVCLFSALVLIAEGGHTDRGKDKCVLRCLVQGCLSLVSATQGLSVVGTNVSVSSRWLVCLEVAVLGESHLLDVCVLFLMPSCNMSQQVK